MATEKTNENEVKGTAVEGDFNKAPFACGTGGLFDLPCDGGWTGRTYDSRGRNRSDYYGRWR